MKGFKRFVVRRYGNSFVKTAIGQDFGVTCPATYSQGV